ncbi:MAG: hypothetical protein NW226_18930 [Microscillaceae bacterium]|nr:hypothetical protein [Microscillaceae bacterium]
MTDGIIRSCLNLDGSKEREKGFYFDLANDNAFVEFNFQRGTSVDKLEAYLGRQVSDDEIERAKAIPFSVDYVFCSVCESYFTEIESKFIAETLPNFRNANLSETEKIAFDAVKYIRLFFYLQVWRTSICDDTLKVSEDISENLRQIILNFKSINVSDLNHFPISVTYLETVGDEQEYTTNNVGYSSDTNPNLIFFNDFVIQFYENEDAIRYFDFYGLNNSENFKELINCKEQKFLFNIFSNDKRKQFLNLFAAKNAKQLINSYADFFAKLWLKRFGVYPPSQTTQEYLKTLVGDSDFHILTYTKENIIEVTFKFLQDKIR